MCTSEEPDETSPSPSASNDATDAQSAPEAASDSKSQQLPSMDNDVFTKRAKEIFARHKKNKRRLR